MNFGNGLNVPAPQMVDNFRTYAHRVSSDKVTIIDDRTIEITGFNYDGQGPGNQL